MGGLTGSVGHSDNPRRFQARKIAHREWAEYEAANRRANIAYRNCGCPDCGDLVPWGKPGAKCKPCKRRLRSVA